MAAVIRGLTTAETAALTEAMRDSGECWDLSDLAPVVDKHSTGGVGDKVTLVAGAARRGGRGARRHDVGPGTRAHGRHARQARGDPGLSDGPGPPARAGSPARKVGAALFAQTDTVAPADRILYALRDVTGDGRIAGADHGLDPLQEARLRHDRDRLRRQDGRRRLHEDARGLARPRPVAGGHDASRGPAGLGLDHGHEPAPRPRRRATPSKWRRRSGCSAGRARRRCGRSRFSSASRCSGFADPDLLEAAARQRLEDAIASGRAARVFERLIEAQGGDPRVVEDPSRLPQPTSRSPGARAALGLRPLDRDGADGVSLDRHRLRAAHAARTRSIRPRAFSSRRRSATASKRASRWRCSASGSARPRAPASKGSSRRSSRSATSRSRRRRSRSRGSRRTPGSSPQAEIDGHGQGDADASDGRLVEKATHQLQDAEVFDLEGVESSAVSNMIGPAGTERPRGRGFGSR